MHNENFDYKGLCDRVVNIAKSAGDYIRLQAKLLGIQDIEVKGSHNYVTYEDKTAEEMLVTELRTLLPEAGFITEEETDSTTGENFNWIIDPLDGTTNFIHQVPVYCVSIALMENREIVVGVIYEINLDECFYAWKNGDSMLNGKKISVSPNNDFDTSLLATGFPYYDYGKMDAYIEVFRDMMKATAGLRRLGSAAADMAYTAAGRFEGFYEYGLHPWDVAAGVLIIKQAGGIVTDYKGGDDYVFGKELVCGNTAVHKQMLKIIQRYFV
jgi:myo-inositol-1(or 4)-monophosphatase